MSQLKTTKLRKRDANKIPTLKYEIFATSQDSFLISLYWTVGSTPSLNYVWVKFLKGGFAVELLSFFWHCMQCLRAFLTESYMTLQMSLTLNSCQSAPSTGSGIIVTLKPSLCCSILWHCHLQQFFLIIRFSITRKKNNLMSTIYTSWFIFSSSSIIFIRSILK